MKSSFQCLLIFCFGSAWALHIIIGPAGKTFITGDTAKLKCITSGPAPGLQFTRDGFGLGGLNLIDYWRDYGYSMNHSIIKHHHMYQLIIKNITLCDEATFECQVPQFKVGNSRSIVCCALPLEICLPISVKIKAGPCEDSK